jgi:hypothetical protein
MIYLQDVFFPSPICDYSCTKLEGRLALIHATIYSSSCRFYLRGIIASQRVYFCRQLNGHIIAKYLVSGHPYPFGCFGSICFTVLYPVKHRSSIRDTYLFENERRVGSIFIVATPKQETCCSRHDFVIS